MADVIEEYFRCGSCRAMVIQLTDRMGRKLGQCDLKPRTGSVAAHDYACIDYRLDRNRLVPNAKVPDDADTTPRQRQRQRVLDGATERMQRASKPRRPRPEEPPPKVKLQQIPLGEDGEGGQEAEMDRDELKKVLAEVLDEALGVSDAPMHKRYLGGKVVIHPANPEHASKEVDIDVLYRKIVTVRDKLRVLEHKLNSNEELPQHDKVQMRGYITGCYGALKTFNFLFRDREEWFGG